MNFKSQVENSWKHPNFLTLALLPLSWLYAILFGLRTLLYRHGLLTKFKPSVPVIVVGNITVGGTGKTPLTVYLIELLRNSGFNPGVISRGYGSKAQHYPYVVRDESSVDCSGDEPALIVKRTGVPLVIGSNRKESIESLLHSFPKVDIILSDDGLQHLALERDIEICVVNATDQCLNENLFPAGPYRESKKRLKTVDLIVSNGALQDLDSIFSMKLIASEPVKVNPAANKINDRFDPMKPTIAVAGIGNPERFFRTCRELGFDIDEVVFADHHRFKQADIEFGDKQVLMTEKDAVKCVDFSGRNHWYLPVDAKLSKQFDELFLALAHRVTIDKSKY
ncbi:MAG: tetraacyldisaccharide 4'-kinase [Gammaproteobacteria bacterium]|nr:tetraacyldisaccharide 4'-kinase [Gammaproteobacteria bacterium]